MLTRCWRGSFSPASARGSTIGIPCSIRKIVVTMKKMSRRKAMSAIDEVGRVFSAWMGLWKRATGKSPRSAPEHLDGNLGGARELDLVEHRHHRLVRGFRVRRDGDDQFVVLPRPPLHFRPERFDR